MNHRVPILAASFYGATGVAIGAFGAHALRPLLIERGMLDAWETGVHYQLFHAVALLGLAAWLRVETGVTALRRARWATACWCVGIAFFAGSLYVLALGGPRWVGPVTPLGGLALIVGWAWVAAAGSASPRSIP
jgi:uncharacterized membrane protein YgdD (TMEM256/DUF423 family)